jgi:hypothetical protein
MNNDFPFPFVRSLSLELELESVRCAFRAWPLPRPSMGLLPLGIWSVRLLLYEFDGGGSIFPKEGTSLDKPLNPRGLYCHGMPIPL